MDKMVELENRLNEQIKSIDNIENLGISQITTRNDGFDTLLFEADELVRKVLSSANRSDDGRLVSETNIQYNTDELAEFFSANKRIKDTIANMKEKMAIVKDSRIKMAKAVTSRMNAIRIDTNQSNRAIESKRNRISELQKELYGPSINDTLKEFIEDEITSLKDDIKDLEERIEKNNSDYAKLDKQRVILVRGGEFTYGSEVDDKDIDLNNTETESKDDKKDENTQVNETENEPETDDKSKDAQVSGEDNKEPDEEPLEMKDRLSENEDAKIDGEGVVAETEPKVMTPDIEDTPNPPEADPTRQDAVVDPNGADMSTESESEDKSKDGEAVVPLPEPIKGGEEPQKVTNVHQPKPGLWSKVKETLAKVGPWLLVLLGGIGIGVGVTNVINNNVETTEESDEETNDESATRGSYPGFVGAVEAPATEEAPAAADDKAVEIKTGEAVYDTATGIEVTRDGSAYSHEGNTTTQVESRDLEQTNNNTAIVTQQDLQQSSQSAPAVQQDSQQSSQSTPVVQQDSQQPNEFAVTSLERTGEEVPEEVARATMTEQEQANLDSAVDDALSNAFNSAFAGGYNPYFSSNEPKL